MTVRSLKDQLASLREELESLEPSVRDRAKLNDTKRRMEALVNEIPTEIKVEEPTPKRKHSILESRGVGKEFWRKIEVDEYIRKGRDSWR